MGPSAETSRPDAGAVRRWRERTLVEAGVDGPLASRLAGEPELDLHALLVLLDAGCPAHLAARIVAPLDPRWDAGG